MRDSGPARRAILGWTLFLLAVHLLPLSAQAGPPDVRPSLWGYSGIWDAPTAYVMEDWNLRLGVSSLYPYTAYQASLGLFGRAEVHGQFTEIAGIRSFGDEGYGDYKDRLMGFKFVLLEEDDTWPQVAVGALDVTGTGLFASRYLVASKRIGPAVLTSGLAQGALGADAVNIPGPGREPGDKGLEFLFSSPWRKTRPFWGVELPLTEDLTLSTEYTFMDYEGLYGSRTHSAFGLSAGLKYRLWDRIHLSGALTRGNQFAGSIAAQFPLSPQGLFDWERDEPYDALEKIRQEAHRADKNELARIVARQIGNQGFAEVTVRASDTALWIEGVNEMSLSEPRALARMGEVADQLAPPRVTLLFLSLKRLNRVRLCLKTDRQTLRAFLDSRMNEAAFLEFATLSGSPQADLADFAATGPSSAPAEPGDDRFSFSLDPKVRSFVNNRKGFLLNKAVLQARAAYEPLRSTLTVLEAEQVLYNEYSRAKYDPLEKNSARTDIMIYEGLYGFRITQMAVDQLFELPWGFQGRASAGFFESAYGGIGLECFRYFGDGRFGLGLESEMVRKRDPHDNLGFSSSGHIFTTAFLNLYAQLWPEMGVDMGVKTGRFLAGDWGARVDLRRTFDHFTVGAWATFTDTSIFKSPQNRGHIDSGVYIRVPLSVFLPRDEPGHFRYTLSGFTRDQGQTVRQPRTLYPATPEATPVFSRSRMDEMRAAP